MKVLFFSNISFSGNNSLYNGGGWIGSFINYISKHSDIHPAVCFIGDSDKVWNVDGVTLFQIERYNSSSFLSKRINDFKILFGNCISVEKQYWSYYEKKILSVVSEFDPDINHIFGSEQYFGLIASLVQVPTVLHIQGFLNPCKNALFPPGFSWSSLINFSNPISYISTLYLRKIWEMQCFREKEIMSRVFNFIGRTEWDKSVTFCFNSKANYFYGSEILREEFYDFSIFRTYPQKFIIISTISNATYKGFDMILKTASILKQRFRIEFEWKVYGNINSKPYEDSISIIHDNVNVHLLGTVDSLTLRQELSSSTCYMHPSYIDNSPNSLCEAQILGIPVVACNVGGVSSLVKHSVSGFLVPANDPYMAAFFLRKLYLDRNLNIEIGNNAKRIAKRRHDKQQIFNDVLNVYSRISK